VTRGELAALRFVEIRDERDHAMGRGDEPVDDGVELRQSRCR
jgi:hypothetical protein